MKIVKWAVVILAIALVIAAVMAPIGPTPGIFIGGASTEVPSSWGDTQSIEEIHLQVGSGPVGRTVIIWTVQVDGDLYVTGQRDSGWVSGIGSGGPVRMQMAGNLYDLTAVPVTEGAVRVLEAWQAKYMKFYPDMMNQFPAPAEGVKTARVYRLDTTG